MLPVEGIWVCFVGAGVRCVCVCVWRATILWKKAECLSHCLQSQHSVLVASAPLPEGGWGVSIRLGSLMPFQNATSVLMHCAFLNTAVCPVRRIATPGHSAQWPSIKCHQRRQLLGNCNALWPSTATWCALRTDRRLWVQSRRLCKSSPLLLTPRPMHLGDVLGA